MEMRFLDRDSNLPDEYWNGRYQPISICLWEEILNVNGDEIPGGHLECEIHPHVNGQFYILVHHFRAGSFVLNHIARLGMFNSLEDAILTLKILWPRNEKIVLWPDDEKESK